MTPIGAAEYYEPFPSAENRPGDIWVGLPTHGTMPMDRLPGLVITPACDLANRKVETATYLPIVSVAEYFASRSFLPELVRNTAGQLKASRVGLEILNPAGLPMPRPMDLTAALELVEERLADASASSSVQTAAGRAKHGLALLQSVVTGVRHVDSVAAVRALLGEGEFGRTVSKIVRNGYRADLHFLPPDEQPQDWTAVPAPSVALFRYPLTVPLDLLDLAASSTEGAWSGEADRLSAVFPCARSISDLRPLKILRVRPRFLSDLLTRFTGLYGRLGSPDFSEDTVLRLVDRIGGGM